jgi:hypothetical protein
MNFHKSLQFTFLLVVCCLRSFAQPNMTGINNPSPSTNAALDIKNTTGFNQGLLIPRLPSTVKATWTGLGMADQGLMFYGTGTDSVYYWTGTKWLSLASNGTSGGAAWSLTGNNPSLLDTNANFLGTNNNYPLLFKTNGVERMRISRFGNVAIGKVPVGGIPLQVKSNSNGVVFRLEAQGDAVTNTLFDHRETPLHYGRMVLYDPVGGQTIQLSADPNFPSYINNSDFGIGTVSPEEALHLYRGNVLIEGEANSPTATGVGGMLKFKGGNFTHAFVNDANRDLTMWLYDGASWRENVKFVNNGEFMMGKLASSTFDFMVDKYGNLSRVHGVNYSWPTTQGSGVLTNDGTGILTWASGGSISGTGIANRMPYWTGTNTLGATALQTDGATFGIGIAPLATVAFRISTPLATGLQVINTNATGEAIYGISNSASGGVGVHGVASGGRGVYGQASSAIGIGGYFEHSSATSVALATGVGRVGIGTSNPSTLLHVFSSSTNAVLMLDAPSASAKGIAFANAGTTAWGIETVPANGSLAIANVGFGGNPIMIANTTGFMGLAITPPLDALHLGTGKRIRLADFAVSGAAGMVTSSALGVLTKVDFTGTATDVLRGDGTFGAAPAGPWAKTGTSIYPTVLTDYVGIGINTPHAPLQLATSTANRKIVLYETGNNDHQFYGLGINNAVLRYQTDQTTSDHVFYAAASATASNELMRIKGTGLVGVGTAAPGARLHVYGGEFRVENNPADAGTGRMRLIGNTITWNLSFTLGQHSTGEAFLWNDANNRMSFGTNNSEKMVILANGNVGVGTANPVATLHVSGNIAFSPKSTGKLGLAAGFSIDPVSTYIRMNATAVISSSTTTAILDGDTAGQILILHNNSVTGLPIPTITIQDAANTKLAGNADFAMGIDDTLILIWDGADWLEISRSNN